MIKRFVWIVVALLVVGGLVIAMRPRPVAVDLAAVTRGTIRSFVEEEGRTRVVERFVVAAPVAGRLMRVGLNEGDPVKKGQLIAEIDPLPLRNEVFRTKAQVSELRSRMVGVDRKKPKAEEIEYAETLETVAERSTSVAKEQLVEAEARLKQVGLELDRVRRLVRAKALTNAELDSAETVVAEARARRDAREQQVAVASLRLAAARINTRLLKARQLDYEWEKQAYAEQIAGIEARLEVLQDNLRRAKIKSPADGILLTLYQESQRYIQAGEQLLEVGNLAEMEVEVDFLSEDAARMKERMEAEIFGRALGGRVIKAAIKRIYPSAFRKISSLGVEQQRVTVLVAATEPFSLGDRYRVEVKVILAKKRSVLLVPEGALFRHAGGWNVFRIDAGRAVRTPVKTGLRDGRRREVIEGLAEDDRVVLHPDDSIEDSVEVRELGGK